MIEASTDNLAAGLISPYREAAFNLALEDYLLRNLAENQVGTCFLYINQPSVVIGRNQCIYTEVNLDYCKQHGIDIKRRISGGGTVFHDAGNINIAFFDAFESSRVNSYMQNMRFIIQALKSLGIDSYLNPRNALFSGEYKLGGTAQFTNRKHILTHCTLLFDTDLQQLTKSISPSLLKAETRASASVPSVTANLRSLLVEDMHLDSFLIVLVQSFAEQGQNCLLAKDLPQLQSFENQVQQMQSFEWIYGRSPDCVISFSQEAHEVELQINKGVLIEVKCDNTALLRYWKERIGKAVSDFSPEL
jgi:lipoate-protein ligase A